ncbi:MAG: phosphatidylglycerophosphatase A [Maritimibacter sp.]
MKQIIGTFLFTGYLKPAPGTWGSLAALPFVWALHVLGGPWLLGVAIVIAFFAGLWATKGITEGTDNKDPSEIVIDEVVGMWIAMLPASIGATAAGADVLALYPGWISAFVFFRLFDIWKPLALYPGWISAFVFFRLFDIWKPSIIGKADRRGDALGVMLDDVYAGAFAAVVTLVLAAGSHLVLMPLLS